VTSFIIEHQCPQCGAPAELEETDRLFQCGYCRVKSYLTVPDYFRYTLPHHAPAGKELFYFPYWRFKGMLFSCLKKNIDMRFLDISHQALGSVHFPVNIGFRGQTQKLRFATAQEGCTFLRPDVAFEDVQTLWREQFSAKLPKPILHQDFIGETWSMIYAPFYFGTRVMDAVLNEPVSTARADQLTEGLLQADDREWPINFLATLCPHCGWDLTGGRDALVLTCGNCRRMWWERKGRLEQLKAAHIPTDAQTPFYLPFWRIQADVSHVRLETYADLIKAANMPKVVQPGWDQTPFYFWNPAFKVRPHTYLTIASNVTLNQPHEKIEPGRPQGETLPVNLPLQEAVESLKLNLAQFIRPIERRLELIPQVEIRPRRFLLIYLPFQDTPFELVQPTINLAVSKSALAHAKNL
jgi:ribosomal protein S27AE